MTREEFNALTRDEKIDVMLAAFADGAFAVVPDTIGGRLFANHCCSDPHRVAAKVKEILDRRTVADAISDAVSDALGLPRSMVSR